MFHQQEDNEFSWSSLEHRLLLQTMVMTGSDLCTSAKPWDQQLKTVSVIYEEFYIQVITSSWGDVLTQMLG